MSLGDQFAGLPVTRRTLARCSGPPAEHGVRRGGAARRAPARIRPQIAHVLSLDPGTSTTSWPSPGSPHCCSAIRRPPGGERADRGGGRHRPARRLHLTRPIAAGARCLRRGRPPVVAGPHPGPAARRDPGAEPHLRQHQRHPRGGPRPRQPEEPAGLPPRAPRHARRPSSYDPDAAAPGILESSVRRGESRSGTSCGRSDELEKASASRTGAPAPRPLRGRAAARSRGRGRRRHRRPRLGSTPGFTSGAQDSLRGYDGQMAQLRKRLDRRADPVRWRVPSPRHLDGYDAPQVSEVTDWPRSVTMPNLARQGGEDLAAFYGASTPPAGATRT